MKPLRAAWYLPELVERRASLRYRCLYPMAQLRQRGLDVSLLSPGSGRNFDAVVFDAWGLFPTTAGESQAEASLHLAMDLKSQGVKIVLDNCDNQFAGAPSEAWQRACQRLRNLALLADRVVTCSPTLADEMMNECQLQNRPLVIGDPIETEIRYAGDGRLKSLLSPGRKLSWLRYLRHRYRIACDRSQGATPLVWFGSHGNGFAEGGMLDLKRVLPSMARAHRSHPLSLTVISNNRPKFDAEFAHQPFPTHYLEWDRINFLSSLKLHAISVIPVTANRFTACKSANRVTLSLYHGLNVAADSIPSYEEFSAVCVLDDWEQGLKNYASNPRLRQAHQREGARLASARYSGRQIADQWARALFEVGGRSRHELTGTAQG